MEWFEACELLLRADPGVVDPLPAAEVVAVLVTVLARLAETGADPQQVEGLTAIVERWRAGRPAPNQWFLDYRWLGAQEGTRRRLSITA